MRNKDFLMASKAFGISHLVCFKGNFNWKPMLGVMAVTLMVSAQAQVLKCTNSKTGKVTYSNLECDAGYSSRLIEGRKSNEEIMAEQVRGAEANERNRRNRLAQMEAQRPEQQAPRPDQHEGADKSSSYECRQAQREHETVSSIVTGTSESRRSRINASTVKVNAACGMTTEMMQAPVRSINNQRNPTVFTHCNAGFCYDNLGGVYHRAGPGILTGPNGRTCRGTGTSWNCN